MLRAQRDVIGLVNVQFRRTSCVGTGQMPNGEEMKFFVACVFLTLPRHSGRSREAATAKGSSNGD